MIDPSRFPKYRSLTIPCHRHAALVPITSQLPEHEVGHIAAAQSKLHLWADKSDVVESVGGAGDQARCACDRPGEIAILN